MKIFITGGTGFIGKKLAGRLVGENHDVICGGRDLDKLGALRKKVKALPVDIENKSSLTEILEKERPDILYHCAALVESSSPRSLHLINVLGTENVFYACHKSGIKKIIYLSSVAVVSGNPQTPLTENLPYKATNAYGKSKIEAEKIALRYREKGLKIAVLRPCMVYGEGEPHGLPLLVENLKRRTFPIFGNGENRLHLVSVDNVVDVMVLCLSREEAYEGSYFIADNEALSISELFRYLTGILNVKPPVRIPKWVAFIFLGIPYIGRGMALFLKDRVYSIDRLKNKLGYTPRISVYDGLKRMIMNYINET